MYLSKSIIVYLHVHLLIYPWICQLISVFIPAFLSMYSFYLPIYIRVSLNLTSHHFVFFTSSGEHPQAMHGTNSAAASTTGSAASTKSSKKTSKSSSSSSSPAVYSPGRHAVVVPLLTLLLLAAT